MKTWLVATAEGAVSVRADGDAGGAQASAGAALVIGDDGRTWLHTPHADGWVGGAVPGDLDALAARWSFWMRLGFVAADAALLAWWNRCGPLPTLTWGDAPSPRLEPQPPVSGLYAIVDDLARLRAVLAAGLRLVQLRIKTPADADAAWHAALRVQLREGLAAARDAGATLVVNDHWRLAAELGAEAVHLGQEDLGLLGAAGLAELAATGLALGVSSHAVWELGRARSLAPAHIACGPVWPTLTKAMPWQSQGPHNLGWWCAHAGSPVVAIGGILEPQQVRAAAGAGASAVCLVRGLGDDPRVTVPRFQEAFDIGAAERRPPAPWPHPSLEPGA